MVRPPVAAGACSPSLIQAADRVDSTTGLQMAYLKEWSPRSYQPLELRVPPLLAGSGRAYQADALEVVDRLPEVDIAYLDPPYNQHRYVGNYHVWETLVAWDAPDHYGVACKRVDVRDPGHVVGVQPAPGSAGRPGPGRCARCRAELLVLSGSDEGWMTRRRPGRHGERPRDRRRAGLRLQALRGRPDRHSRPQGKKVGRVGRTRNTEYLIVAGPARKVARLCAGYPTLEPAAIR